MGKADVVRCACLLCLAISVNSDNCRVAFRDYPDAHEVIEPSYLIDLSIKNTVHGLATTYFPDTQYDIIIRPKNTTLSFKEFHFKIENVNSIRSYGALDLREPEFTTFDTQAYCINRVINLATPNKPNVTIGWQSPPSKSGCIQMIAYVKETELRYHNANLTVCEDPRIELDDPGQIVKNCSACERVKYEMTFKGVWSKYTHPRSFPVRDWLAGFPTVIGATHHHDYKIWEVHTRASEAMRKFAETGDSVDLELELKAQATMSGERMDNVTTIIKLRGTNFKNKTQARAQLQVDRRSHVVSLVARINPSPDWFIGVSSLELCAGDTWLEDKTLNLYAYDVGSRTGLTFENNAYTDDVINRMNMSWPVPPAGSGLRPPFWDPTNNTHEVRPMAIIHFRRMRTFGNTCPRKPEEQKTDEDCFGQWYREKECSATCGEGLLTFKRDYKEGVNASLCDGKTSKTEACENLGACPAKIDEQRCQLTEWSGWQPCAATCGQEAIGRTRNFKDSSYQSECKSQYPDWHMHEFKDCGHPPCPNVEPNCNDSLYEKWQNWGECSVTVGLGIKYRLRAKLYLIVVSEDVPEDAGYVGCTYEKAVCEGVDPRSITEAPIVDRYASGREISTARPHGKPPECLLDIEEGEACPGKIDDSSNRWGYNKDLNECEPFRYRGCAGNDNSFDERKECFRECVIGELSDCLMEWTEWSICRDCVKEQTRTRLVKVPPSRHGKPCPKSGNLERKSCNRLLECELLDKKYV
ncbi:spondin-1-like [Phymastichus coffea]|uniref:spondin-1-like n=1 Tax=Phymastichus coffea TaxID=108790 RepID=UPI00273A7F0D|nr:spondin-1-like [Phymastichus coffea]